MVKKLLYFSVICGLSYYLNAQVGIGTDNPGATLHIVPKNQEDPLKVEGLKENANGSALLSVDGQGVVKTTELSTIKSEIKSEVERGEDVKGILIDSRYVQGTDRLDIPQYQTSDIPGMVITYTPAVDCNAFVTISALPIPQTSRYPVQGTVNLLVNGYQINSQYFSASDAPGGSAVKGASNLGNYVTITRVVQLDAKNTYTFKLQAKSWNNTTVFNKNPYNSTPSYSYAGSTSLDVNSMKSNMSILFYSR